MLRDAGIPEFKTWRVKIVGKHGVVVQVGVLEQQEFYGEPVAGRCRTCMGRESGSCVRGDFGCGATEQCVCSGGNVPRSTNWLDIQTCRFGL
ncbi:hypothetical protein Ocin01_19661 [Orchesella cincta]|uniref:Uncharacterized protein n=1 Tax=Orchesella cincta TaxID=48709 RepID=A0A1D2M276_ORCCI|nr:hypothetical protein Ocin01_19661 [Orchesella cincta]